MNTSLPLIPRPSSYTVQTGYVDLLSTSSIAWKGGKDAEGVALLLAEYLRPATGFAWPVVADAAATIILTQTANPNPDEAGFFPEDYAIYAKGKTVHITGSSAAGLARGIQTLRQLLPAEIYASTPQTVQWCVPCVCIYDAPQFRWRGLHLDVSRHFFSVEEVCRYIELLAQHRMNVCHLHLTDDQGWRVEIKRYPKLTSVGGWRDCTLEGDDVDRPRRYDGKRYGGFFTQEDIKTIVRFASRRHITLVPEIDMPGHMQAAIAAYPELGNTDATIKARCHWGISHHILNAEDATVEFMKNVLDEVMVLFPSKFIHIGGDEAEKLEWGESPRMQELMRQRELKNEDELQSWFIGEMNRHILKRGRRAIGWDEILEGGLAKGIAVMAWRSSPRWRGDKDIRQATRQGNDVVIATASTLYFDTYKNEERTLRKFYDFKVVPPTVPPRKRLRILGAQGEVWSEYVKTFSQVEYMVYPRACALAEVLWTPEEGRSLSSFLKRLSLHQKRLQMQGVNAGEIEIAK